MPLEPRPPHDFEKLLIDVVGRTAVPKPDSGLDGTMLADFLESDLRDCTDSAATVLERIAAIRAGGCEKWELTGDSYKLQIFEGYAHLEYLHPRPGRFNLALIGMTPFQDAVAKWLKAGKSPPPALPDFSIPNA